MPPSRMVPLLSACLALVFCTRASADQVTSPATPSTGTITGRVVEWGSNTPIPDATVSFSTDGNRTRTSFQSDADGRFVMTAVPAGGLYITSTKTGFIGGTYGQRELFQPSQRFDMNEGERVTGMVLVLWRHGSVSGRITDNSGAPIGSAEVAAHRIESVDGRRRLGAGRRVKTDRLGNYSITTLFPAPYMLTLHSGTTTSDGAGGAGASQSVLGYPTLYYPGSLTTDGAQTLEITSGAALTGMDFRLTPLPMFAVSGHVEGLPPLGTARPPQVEIVAARPGRIASDLSVATTTVTPTGSFGLPRVPAGDYVLRVLLFPPAERQEEMRPILQTSTSGSGFGMRYGGRDVPSRGIAPVSDAPTLWSETPISVPIRDAQPVSMSLQRGSRVRGRVVFDGSLARPSAEQLNLSPVIVTSAEGRALSSFQAGRIESDGTFSTVEFPPGRYRVMLFQGAPMPDVRDSAAWPAGWTLASFVADGVPQPDAVVDLRPGSDAAVTLTFTDRKTEITGAVRDETGAARPDASVFVFPADRALWSTGTRMRSVRPSRTGTFTIAVLPGEYFVAASADLPELWTEPPVIDRLAAAAQRVRLALGDARVVSLGIVRVKF